MKVDYKTTVFLPKTDFPMRQSANPRARNSGVVGRDRFAEKAALSRSAEKFILHDGPPYANGNLHMGHALNKV